MCDVYLSIHVDVVVEGERLVFSKLGADDATSSKGRAEYDCSNKKGFGIEG